MTIVCKTSLEFLKIAMDKSRCDGFSTEADGTVSISIAFKNGLDEPVAVFEETLEEWKPKQRRRK